jgi:hypothetical protein
MDLLDWAEQHARVSDPVTSHNAAEQLPLTLRCRQFLDGLTVLGSATANEVALHVSGDNRGLHDSIRRRASDLVRHGRIRQVGTRHCGVTGKCVTVYEVVK